MSTATICKPVADTIDTAHRTVSRDQWLRECIAILAEEKGAHPPPRRTDRQIRELPWVKVDKTYNYIDLTPKGRDEAEIGGMGWVRHHDRYGEANFVHPWAERPGITAPLPR